MPAGKLKLSISKLTMSTKCIYKLFLCECVKRIHFIFASKTQEIGDDLFYRCVSCDMCCKVKPFQSELKSLWELLVSTSICIQGPVHDTNVNLRVLTTKSRIIVAKYVNITPYVNVPKDFPQDLKPVAGFCSHSATRALVKSHTLHECTLVYSYAEYVVLVSGNTSIGEHNNIEHMMALPFWILH